MIYRLHFKREGVLPTHSYRYMIFNENISKKLMSLVGLLTSYGKLVSFCILQEASPIDEEKTICLNDLFIFPDNNKYQYFRLHLFDYINELTLYVYVQIKSMSELCKIIRSYDRLTKKSIIYSCSDPITREEYEKAINN